MEAGTTTGFRPDFFYCPRCETKGPQGGHGEPCRQPGCGGVQFQWPRGLVEVFRYGDGRLWKWEPGPFWGEAETGFGSWREAAAAARAAGFESVKILRGDYPRGHGWEFVKYKNRHQVLDDYHSGKPIHPDRLTKNSLGRYGKDFVPAVPADRQNVPLPDGSLFAGETTRPHQMLVKTTGWGVSVPPDGLSYEYQPAGEGSSPCLCPHCVDFGLVETSGLIDLLAIAGGLSSRGLSSWTYGFDDRWGPRKRARFVFWF